jgi:transposase-like protein
VGTEQDVATSTAPAETIRAEANETQVVEELNPACPDCDSADQVSNWDTYQRDPHGRPAVRIQRYMCNQCESTFTASLDEVEDNYRYPDPVRQLTVILYAVIGASCRSAQIICILYFGLCPSRQRIHDWRGESASLGELVANELPSHLFSGFYAYDEQHLTDAGDTKYRLLVYDAVRRVPVAEKLVDRATKETIGDFLTSALEGKPCESVTTDGRRGIAQIVEHDLGVAHHRCLFHVQKNFVDDLETVLSRSFYSESEKKAAAIVGSEFREVLRAPTYSRAVERLEAVLDRVEHLPSTLQDYVEKVDENRKTFLGSLKDSPTPRTTSGCERYYSHTQSKGLKRWLHSQEEIHTFWKQQMALRTAIEGFVDEEVAIALLRDRFPAVQIDAVEGLYSSKKQQFLEMGDIEVD